MADISKILAQIPTENIETITYMCRSCWDNNHNGCKGRCDCTHDRPNRRLIPAQFIPAAFRRKKK